MKNHERLRLEKYQTLVNNLEKVNELLLSSEAEKDIKEEAEEIISDSLDLIKEELVPFVD